MRLRSAVWSGIISPAFWRGIPASFQMLNCGVQSFAFGKLQVFSDRCNIARKLLGEIFQFGFGILMTEIAKRLLLRCRKCPIGWLQIFHQHHVMSRQYGIDSHKFGDDVSQQFAVGFSGIGHKGRDPAQVRDGAQAKKFCADSGRVIKGGEMTPGEAESRIDELEKAVRALTAEAVIHELEIASLLQLLSRSSGVALETLNQAHCESLQQGLAAIEDHDPALSARLAARVSQRLWKD